MHGYDEHEAPNQNCGLYVPRVRGFGPRMRPMLANIVKMVKIF